MLTYALEGRWNPVLPGQQRTGHSPWHVQGRYRRSAWTSVLDPELEDLFVALQARRRAAERGCHLIGLNTNQRNEATVTLCQRLDFVSERARR